MSTGSVADIAVAFLVAAFMALPNLTAQAQEPDPPEVPPQRFYAVVFARGPGFVEESGARGQLGMEQHVKFIVGLHAEGVVPLGGALFDDDGREQVSGILYFVQAGSVEAAREVAMREPLVQTTVLEIASVREFLIGVGVGRLGSPTPVR